MIVKRKNFTKAFKSQMETNKNKQTNKQHKASSLLKRVKSGSSQLTPADLNRATLLGKTLMWGLSKGFFLRESSHVPPSKLFLCE
jgi:hypothetical protein